MEVCGSELSEENLLRAGRWADSRYLSLGGSQPCLNMEGARMAQGCPPAPQWATLARGLWSTCLRFSQDPTVGWALLTEVSIPLLSFHRSYVCTGV